MTTYQITVITPDGRRTSLLARDDQHILDVAVAAGLDLPSRCLQGWCLTCAARLASGTVDQDDSRRYFEEDRQAGFALLCTARPRSDVILETHARDAMRRARARRGLPFPKGDWGRRPLSD